MLTLYHHPFSPSSRFIRLILSEYGAAFEERHINPWERPQELLILNAAGTIPVMVENEGPAICGPGPIMEYLDETRGYAIGDRRLMPDHPDARAETRRLVDWALAKFDVEVIGHLVRERIYKQIMPKSAGGGRARFCGPSSRPGQHRPSPEILSLPRCVPPLACRRPPLFCGFCAGCGAILRRLSRRGEMEQRRGYQELVCAGKIAPQHEASSGRKGTGHATRIDLCGSRLLSTVGASVG
jgi:hypothetical protein